MRSRACSSGPRTSTSMAPSSSKRLASMGVIVGRLMISLSLLGLLALALRCAGLGRAVELLQVPEQRLRPGIGDAVPQRLALAPVGDDLLLAHPGEVLRQRRLRQSDGLGQGADRGLPPLDQF